MDENNIENRVKSLVDSVRDFGPLVGEKIDQAEAQTESLREYFTQTVEVRINSFAPALAPYISALAARANITIFRITFHASPEVFALIMTFVTIFKIVTWVARIVSVIRIVSTIWSINQIILSLWPQYKRWWDTTMAKISEMSAGLGWGVDGILHLVNAVNIGFSLSGRLAGKDWDLLKVEAMERGIKVGTKVANVFNKMAEDPSRYMDDIFSIEQYSTSNEFRHGLWGITNTITNITDKAETAFRGLTQISGELQAIQTGMPEVIRRNIPGVIWSSLAKYDRYIDLYIFPTLTKLTTALNTLDNLLNIHGDKLSEVAGKLSHPGDLLLTVDDLPDYARNTQLGAIDDVTSREFELWTDSERAELQGDLNEFDRIDQLLTAPTPQPGFLGMEIPRGKTVGEITAEPQETWFVGGYNSPY